MSTLFFARYLGNLPSAARKEGAWGASDFKCCQKQYLKSLVPQIGL